MIPEEMIRRLRWEIGGGGRWRIAVRSVGLLGGDGT